MHIDRLPEKWAFEIAKRMRVLYGKKFEQQWGNVSPDELIDAISTGLAGLTNDELARGMHQMTRETWPPTIPELRSWCQPIDPFANAWPTADEAWTIALKNSDEMTTFETFDELQVAWGVARQAMPDNFAARRAFVDVYNRTIDPIKGQGKAPVWWISYGQEKPEQRAVAVESANHVAIGFKADAVAMLEQSKPIASNVNEHLANLKAMFGMTEGSLATKQAALDAERKRKIDAQQVALAQREAVRENWPDPFEDREAYKIAMANMGRTIPTCLSNCWDDSDIRALQGVAV